MLGSIIAGAASETISAIEDNAAETAKRIEFFWMNHRMNAKSVIPNETQTIDSYIFVTGGRPAMYERRSIPKRWSAKARHVTGSAALAKFRESLPVRVVA